MIYVIIANPLGTRHVVAFDKFPTEDAFKEHFGQFELPDQLLVEWLNPARIGLERMKESGALIQMKIGVSFFEIHQLELL